MKIFAVLKKRVFVPKRIRNIGSGLRKAKHLVGCGCKKKRIKRKMNTTVSYIPCSCNKR